MLPVMACFLVMGHTASTVGAGLTYHLGMSYEGLPSQVGDVETTDRALWLALAEESLGGSPVESLTSTTVDGIPGPSTGPMTPKQLKQHRGYPE